MKLVLALTYNINLEDWNTNYINKVTKIYDKVFKDIVLWLQHLQSEELEEIQ